MVERADARIDGLTGLISDLPSLSYGVSVTVTAAVAKGAGGGDWLRLGVADTGLGIKEEDLERISA